MLPMAGWSHDQTGGEPSAPDVPSLYVAFTWYCCEAGEPFIVTSVAWDGVMASPVTGLVGPASRNVGPSSPIAGPSPNVVTSVEPGPSGMLPASEPGVNPPLLDP